MTARADGRGSVSVLAATIVVICGSFGLFLNDAGTALTCATKANNYAAEAGRAANDALGPRPTGGQIDYRHATAGALGYLAQVPNVASAHVTVLGPGRLQVTVRTLCYTPLLHWRVTKERVQTADLEVGTDHGETVP